MFQVGTSTELSIKRILELTSELAEIGVLEAAVGGDERSSIPTGPAFPSRCVLGAESDRHDQPITYDPNGYPCVAADPASGSADQL
jgi:hypothetical protein